MPAFSIVVVTWNSSDELRVLLNSLERCLRGAFELVVVDNASEDDTTACLREWSGRAIAVALTENLGFGTASNIGVRRASHDVVVMMNPDTLVLDDSLAQLAALAIERDALCGPEILNEDGSRQPSASAPPGGWEVGLTAVIPSRFLPEQVRLRCEPWRSHMPVEVGWLTGACIAGPRSTLVRLGPFDEGIHMYGEDMDLGLRARRYGIKSFFAPAVARIVHFGERSAGKRFVDRGLQLKLNSRRNVVRQHLGPRRERYDFFAQAAFHATRYAGKRALGRESDRERAWLQAAVSTLRGDPPS